MNKKARVIAFYLPQYHPIPENDEWWGKGFTEWTNVGKAKPLFRGHYQPRVPADLGYYDLRIPEVREAQAQMAKEAGIEGFMYWHYCFGNGKRLMSDIFDEVLLSGKPDFPFCLGWANHSWYAKNWNAADSKKDKMLIEQKYSGIEDYEKHFYLVLKAFNDPRYIKVNEKPVFLIYAPDLIPDSKVFIDLWNSLAIKNGLKGIHFIAHIYSSNKSEFEKYISNGFNALCRNGLEKARLKIKGKYLGKIPYLEAFKIINEKTGLMPLNKFNYAKLFPHLIDKELDGIKYVYPIILPNFDHSPRSGRNGLIIENSTPILFKEHIINALEAIEHKENEEKIIFLRSWNEWAEGNYVEPDIKFGCGYLDALKKSLI